MYMLTDCILVGLLPKKVITFVHAWHAQCACQGRQTPEENLKGTMGNERGSRATGCLSGLEDEAEQRGSWTRQSSEDLPAASARLCMWTMMPLRFWMAQRRAAG
jgi:hypothetical protein